MVDLFTGRLVAFAVTYLTSAIPEPTCQAAARCLLDTLACGLAGLAEPSSWDVTAVISSEAPNGRCTAIGMDRPVSPRSTAIINRTAAHALDFDDTHD